MELKKSLVVPEKKTATKGVTESNENRTLTYPSESITSPGITPKSTPRTSSNRMVDDRIYENLLNEPITVLTTAESLKTDGPRISDNLLMKLKIERVAEEEFESDSHATPMNENRLPVSHLQPNNIPKSGFGSKISDVPSVSLND